MACSPAKRSFGEQALKVPRAGLHTAPAHRAFFLGDAVTRAFLAIRLPNLIAIKHSFRASRNRAAWTFTSAFITVIAKILQPKIYWLTMGKGHIGCDNA